MIIKKLLKQTKIKNYIKDYKIKWHERVKINLKYANKEVDQVLIDLSKVSTVSLDVHNK